MSLFFYFYLQSFSFCMWFMAAWSSLLHMNNNIWLFRRVTQLSELYYIVSFFLSFLHIWPLSVFAFSSSSSFLYTVLSPHLSASGVFVCVSTFSYGYRKANFAYGHVGLLLCGRDHRRMGVCHSQVEHIKVLLLRHKNKAWDSGPTGTALSASTLEYI